MEFKSGFKGLKKAEIRRHIYFIIFP